MASTANVVPRKSYDPVYSMDEDKRPDSPSQHSAVPLTTPTYPPNSYVFDAERGAQKSGHPRGSPSRPGLSTNSSWDLFSGAQKSYAQFDPAMASEPHLAFADGDVPNTTVIEMFCT